MNGGFETSVGLSGRRAGGEPARIAAWPRIARTASWTAVAVAVVILIGMAAIRPPRSGGPPAISEGAIPRRMAMRQASLSGRLKDGRPYRIVAASAELAEDDNVILLSDLRAAMRMPNGERLELAARSGRFDRGRARMALVGNVVAIRSDGYRLETEAADIWQEAAGLAAASDRATVITGPEGHISGSGLVAAAGLDPVRLTGPVRLDLKGGVGQ